MNKDKQLNIFAVVNKECAQYGSRQEEKLQVDVLLLVCFWPFMQAHQAEFSAN